ATASALSFREEATIRTGPNDGLLLLAGGSGTAAATSPDKSAELYGFATIVTDKADYYPGETATFTGAGWIPGETVTLTVVELANLETVTYHVVADSEGTIR